MSFRDRAATSYSQQAARQIEVAGSHSGTGMKHSIITSKATTAKATRTESSGRSSYTGGIRRNRSANKIPAHKNHTVAERFQNPSASNARGTIQPIPRCHRLLSDRKMCPPSSCPAGSKLSEVANNPTHAARATGCNKIVPESTPGKITLSTSRTAKGRPNTN